MDDVARAVGIARRTLFTYYPTKNAIVWDGRRQATDALAEALARVPADAAWRPALAETLATALRFPADDLDLLRRRLQLIGSTPALRAHLSADQEAGVDVVAGFVAARLGSAAGDLTPSVAAHAVMAAMSAALVWWSTSEESDPRAVLRRALRTVLLPERS